MKPQQLPRRHHNLRNNRRYIRRENPPLPKPTSWVETASFDPLLALNLFIFLSPTATGTLIYSIFNADRLSLVQFVFPNERLPNWFRLSKDCRVLNDLYVFLKGRVVEGGVVLNVFVFWFAHYSVSWGLGAVNVTSCRKSSLEYWTLAIPVLSSGVKQSMERKDEASLYLRKMDQQNNLLI